MRILFYGINYHPELTGIGKYTGEACEWLAAKGHTIEVITTPPYYPSWAVSADYKGKMWHTEHINGVKVHRCPFYVPKKVTTAKRMVSETTFMLSSLVYWFKVLFSRKFDVVVCVCPPFQLAFLPIFYAKLRGVPFMYHTQDLQVDIAAQMGMIKSQWLINVLFKVEKYLLNQATLVSSISEGMLKKITEKGLKHNKMWLFPNWVDTKFITPLSKKASLIEKLGYTLNDFIILYSGNMGEKQGLDIVVDVADALKNNEKIKFVMVGEGNSRGRLEAAVKEKRLTNIRFFPLQPYADLPKLLAMADIHLVLQQKSAADLVLPSKLTGILSAGGLSIATASPASYLYEVMAQHQLGVVIEPENTMILSNAIQSLMSNPESVGMYKANAVKYADLYLNKDVILAQLENVLDNLVKKNS